MEGDGAGLTHCSEQAGLTISSCDVAQVLLYPPVQTGSHSLATSATIQGPPSPRLLGGGQSEDEWHAEIDGGAQVRDRN